MFHVSRIACRKGGVLSYGSDVLIDLFLLGNNKS